jgi:integrase
MATKKVGLVRHCKTPLGWRRLPIVIGGNGRLRQDYAMLNGKPTHLPEGHFELRSYVNRKAVYENVGTDAAEALNKQRRATRLTALRESATAAGIKIETPDGERVNLLKRKDDFVQRHIAKGQKRAAQKDGTAIQSFLDATGHVYADQVTESSILTWYKHMRALGNSDRTVYGKHVSVFGWFKWMGVDTKKLADRPPSYTEKEVAVFHSDDLRILFDASDRYQKVVYETLLKTGLRMAEAMHLEWSNVDFRSKRIRVREILEGSKAYETSIKDRAERSVPLPDDLSATLKAWKAERPGTVLVLGTKNDTPNWKWLQMLKRGARKAGLNCGNCPTCRKTDECSRWIIHRFRATYTTTLLRNGVDVRTVMSFTGHSDMATVMRYLAAADDTPMQVKLSSISWM